MQSYLANKDRFKSLVYSYIIDEEEPSSVPLNYVINCILLRQLQRSNKENDVLIVFDASACIEKIKDSIVDLYDDGTLKKSDMHPSVRELVDFIDGD